MATHDVTDDRTEEDRTAGSDPAATTEAEDAADNEPDSCHDTVSKQRQAEVLERDRYQCRTCGRKGPQRGGLATLHIHHITRDPDDVDVHDPANLTTLCRPCHNWIHLRSTADESPTPLTEADVSVLLPQDIEILRYLSEAGPARTGDIAAGLNVDLSVSAIRERLWVLMGLDNMVESRDRQIVDKDIETGEWGLVGQIELSARGHIPDDPQLLLQRIEDEQVREALERGVDRRAIMDALDVSRRTTFNKEKRACAFGFPLDAFRRGDCESLRHDITHNGDQDVTGDEAGADGQQERNVAVEDVDDVASEPAETWGLPADDDGVEADAVTAAEEREVGRTVMKHQLETAIDALKEVVDAL
jgi:hypothetical protein